MRGKVNALDKTSNIQFITKLHFIQWPCKSWSRGKIEVLPGVLFVVRLFSNFIFIFKVWEYCF